MAKIYNNRGKALIIEKSEDGLELTIEHVELGETEGVVFTEPETIMAVFSELVEALKEMGADIAIDLVYRQTPVSMND